MQTTNRESDLMETQKIGIIGTGGRGEHARRAHQPENGWIVAMGADT